MMWRSIGRMVKIGHGRGDFLMLLSIWFDEQERRRDRSMVMAIDE
jgi:hypothetical protein